jgi:hypothetical protein
VSNKISLGLRRMNLTIRKLQGGTEYKKFLDGKKLTRKEAMLAHCYQCMGGFEGGKQDCLGRSCPMHQYYPYRGLAES